MNISFIQNAEKAAARIRARGTCLHLGRQQKPVHSNDLPLRGSEDKGLIHTAATELQPRRPLRLAGAGGRINCGTVGGPFVAAADAGLPTHRGICRQSRAPINDCTYQSRFLLVASIKMISMRASNEFGSIDMLACTWNCRLIADVVSNDHDSWVCIVNVSALQTKKSCGRITVDAVFIICDDGGGAHKDAHFNIATHFRDAVAAAIERQKFLHFLPWTLLTLPLTVRRCYTVCWH